MGGGLDTFIKAGKVDQEISEEENEEIDAAARKFEAKRAMEKTLKQAALDAARKKASTRRTALKKKVSANQESSDPCVKQAEENDNLGTEELYTCERNQAISLGGG